MRVYASSLSGAVREVSPARRDLNGAALVMDYRPMEIDELRERLERGEKLTILDIRRPEDRKEWYIPGSIYHDAYDALKAGDGEILLGIPVPSHAPVVAVCYRGNTSIIAANQLTGRGLTAYSLEGGMQAWSLAWNTAEISDGSTTLIQVRRTGKGCLSYLAGSHGEAFVIDPSLDAAVYLSLAGKRGGRYGMLLTRMCTPTT